MLDPQTIAIIAGQLVLGGAERQLYLWLSNLDRNRFRPVVVTLHPGCDDYWEKPIEALGVDILRIRRRRSKVLRLAEINNVLGRYRPALIHGWHLFTSPYAGVAARFIGARASLGSVRGSFQTYLNSGLRAPLTDLLTDGLVVNSARVARQIECKPSPFKRRVFAVPNAVEPVVGGRVQARLRFAERWKIPDSRIWLASVGRFENLKRFDLLLKLTASLAGEGEDLHAVLFGYGEGAAELRSLARALGIEDRVTFTGADAEARLWMEAFDVFCFTSTDEGLPNAVMEAAAAGVPVLAWRTDFLRELLGSSPSAVVVEEGDFRGLRQGLAGLLESRELRQRVGRGGQREILARFGVPSLVKGLTAVYDELLQGNMVRPR
jgi:glycosyltransferase involved in cell wall biosynthesis